MNKPKVILIAGPTGVGKTAASVILAQKLNTEIISCDSMQIYKGMDIGTAKVTPREAQGIAHHMIDVASPKDNFSVCDYVSMAAPIIERMALRGKPALIVGGTGLYADSLIKGIKFSEQAPADEEYRKHMECIAREKGVQYVHDMLKEADPDSAQSIHPNNIKRVIRALEYYHASGERISEHNKRTQNEQSPYDSVRIYFTRERKNLYERIDRRVDIMISEGLEAEVRALLQGGISRDTTAMQALGYKEIADALEGSITMDEAVELIKRDSRRYAKRQLTWFKRDSEGIWVNLDEFDTPEAAADRCMDILAERSML